VAIVCFTFHILHRRVFHISHRLITAGYYAVILDSITDAELRKTLGKFLTPCLAGSRAG